MRRIKREEEEEGAMGVGTLIVFIAMVLVAAVAASVLISTANKLQQQAQKTGDQAIREVSTAFTIRDVYGLDKNGNSEITEINLTIGLAAGSPVQNVNQTTILVRTSDSEDMLSAGTDWDSEPRGQTSASAGSNYGVIPVKEQEDGNLGNIEQGDTVKLKINGLTLTTQAELTIKIIPKHGTPTVEELVTPPVINQYTTHF